MQLPFERCETRLGWNGGGNSRGGTVMECVSGR